MRTGILGTAAVLLLLSNSSTATAHHAFCAEYDMNNRIVVVGKVVKIEWSNPHVYMQIDVTDVKGAVQRWTIHAAAASALSKGAWTRETLKAGDEVSARLARAKDGSNRGSLLELVFRKATLVPFPGTNGSC